MKRVFHFSAKAVKIILITTAFIFIALAIFLNSNYFDQFIKRQIQERLGKAIDRKITVGSVSFNPFFLDVQLNDFVIGNDPRSPDKEFFRARAIYADVSWRHAFRGKLRISEVRLDKPEINIVFYKEGGNNWPKTKPRKEQKKGGVDFVINKVDCDNMTVIVDQRRVPVSFSVTDLETFAEYDKKQKNYRATTNFKDGYLKIQNFEFFKFDLKSNYQIIGGRILFQRLDVLSNQSKFYMTGEMYNLKDPFFDFRIRSRLSIDQAKKMFHLGPEMSGWGNYRAVYKGTFSRFRMQGRGNFKNFIFYSLPIDRAEFDLDMTDNWLNVTNIKANMFEGNYDGNFSVAPLKGKSIYKTDAKFNNWDGRKLGDFVRMKNLILPVKGSGSADMTWEEGRFKEMNGDFKFMLEPTTAQAARLANSCRNKRFR